MSDTELVIKINGDIKGYEKALKSVTAETKELQDQLNTIAKTGAIAFAGFATAIVLAAKSAGEFETISTQFEVLTGSAEEAKKAIKNLSDFAAKTPFQFPDIARAAKQLLAFKISGDDLTPTLQRIGDVSAATGARFGELSLIFGQVKAAGKLTGERLLQLEERAIPIGPALAKTMGVAETSIRELVTKGEISFKTFEKAFASLSEKGGLAFEGMAKNSKTFEGQLSTLADNFDLVTAQVGKNFLPMLKELTAAFINVLEYIRENPGLTDFIAKMLIAGTVTGALLTTLALGTTIFLKLRAAIIASTLATRGLSFAVKGLIGSTGLGLLIAFLPEILDMFKFVFEGSLDVVKRVGRTLAGVAKGIGLIFKGLFTLDPADIKRGGDEIANALNDIAFKTEELRKKNIESAKKEKAELAKIQAEKQKAADEAARKAETEAKKGVDKKRQALLDENALIKAQLAGVEKDQIAFLKRRQEIRNKATAAEAIQDKDRKAAALENVKLLNQQIVKEEEDLAKKKKKIADKKQAADDQKAAKDKEAADKEAEAVRNKAASLAAEREVLRAHQADLTDKEISFIEKKQALKTEAIAAEQIKDKANRDLALENNKLKNDLLLEEEALFRENLSEARAEQQELDTLLTEELNELSREQREALKQEDIDSLKSGLATKAQLRAKAAKDELLSKRKEAKLLADDEKRFGSTIASIKQFQRSENLKQAQIASQALISLQKSENSALQVIGKAAALVQIAIDTQRGAIAAYTSLAGIPIVGPGLGAAAAAALVAYGTERAIQVTAAAQGGLVGGSGFGDTQPFMLTPGELVVPRQNFEEVVTAISNQRASQDQGEEGGGATEAVARIQVDYASEEAADIITVQTNEQRYLGISQGTR